MNEEIQKQIIVMLQESMKIAKEQIPDALNQYLQYIYNSNVITMWSFAGVTALLFMLTLLFGILFAFTSDDEENPIASPAAHICAFGIIATVAAVIISAIAIPSYYAENYAIKHTPKGYLVGKVIGK